MDRDTSCNICTDSVSGNAKIGIYDQPDSINRLTSLGSLRFSFGDNLVDNNLLSEQKQTTIKSHVSEPTDQPIEIMGIDNTWNDENSFGAPPPGDFPIPLPPPGGFDDLACLDADVQPPESDLRNIFASETDSHDDVRDCSACPGVCGLRNLGNTCFMAAGLQCLSATSELMQFFLAREAPGEKEASHSLTDQFSALVHKVWSGSYGVVQPVEFKQALGVNHPQFKDYRQHDCQEFLALLLDNLHEQLNTASCKSILSDVSTAPPTPHSQCEASDERKVLTDSMDLDSTTQTDGLRCGHSTSSHSSESSGESRNPFRLQPIPEDIQPFKDISNLENIRVCEPSIDKCGSHKSINQHPSVCNIETKEPSFIYNKTSGDSCLSNNMTRNFLKTDFQELNVDSTKEKNEVAMQLNSNVSPRFRGLEDILKDAKTSNVNVLVTEHEANNEIRFDSEKFPKYESIRRRDPLEMPNLTEFHNFDGKIVSVKRIKETNLLHDTLELESEPLERMDVESSNCYNNIKRMKLEEQEKNFRMECERKLRHLDETEAGIEDQDDDMSGAVAASDPPISLNDEIEADKHWEKHLSINQSVIVDTFQGQFKSTVVCSACKHVSVTYEPFMYLSVPLPRAMERQICVTFVPSNSKEPTRFLVILDKQDKVQKLKEELLKCIGCEATKNIALAEVLDSHIARILDDNSLLRYVNDTNRSIYAFELLTPPMAFGMDANVSLPNIDEPNDEKTPADVNDGSNTGTHTGEPLDLTPGLCEQPPNSPASTETASEETDDITGCIGPLSQTQFEQINALATLNHNEKSDGWRSCAICLEEMDSDLRRHATCSCVLCESCIEISCQHHGGNLLPCPVCGVIVNLATEFVYLDKLGDYKPTVRLLNVPVVFRLDTEGDGNNNKKMMKLFGHPNLVHLPNRLTGQDLYEAVDRLVPYSLPYSILLVDGQGYHCSRCMYTVHCRGCRVAPDEPVQLQTGDTLAVRLYEPLKENLNVIEHSSMKKRRSQDPLSLYDCLQAFSESEQLDEHNPWYCPVCQKNQCATKTLSVWRYPDFLIVYLKRFIFHDCVSIKLDNKVTFPLSGLSVTPPSILQHGAPLPYNLYACVCHYGGSSAGHYTAYAKNPRTNEWHYFNDDTVTKQKPQEEDYSNAYILFYQKQGVSFDLNIPKLFLGEGSPKPNIEQIILDLDSSVEQDWQRENMAHTSAS